MNDYIITWYAYNFEHDLHVRSLVKSDTEELAIQELCWYRSKYFQVNPARIRIVSIQLISGGHTHES